MGSERCAQCREALSARLDGEPEPAPAAWTDRHLAGCPDCRGWQRQAAEVTRRLRVRPVAPDPRLAERVLALAGPARRGRRWRIALAAVAAAQLALGLAQLAGWDAGMLVPSPAHHDMTTHLFDESTAWNIALAVGLGWVAWRTRAATGVLPLLGGFLLLLTGFCVHDLVAGRVPVVRVAEHGLLLLGFTIMLAVRRTTGDPPRPLAAAGTDDHPSTPPGGTGEPAPPGRVRHRPGGFRPRPVNRRRAA